MHLSNRLKAISALVDDNSTVIDVGCDHALLDIYLFKNKKNVKIIASDIKEGPLRQAKKNIDKYQCDIKLKLGKGLSTIEDDVDTLIISGMGGDTIINILDEGSGKLCFVQTIILSPQSNWEKVRRYMMNLGYRIVSEQLIKDTKVYLILKCDKGESKYTDKELTYGPLLLQKKDDIFIEYYQEVLRKKISVYNNMESSKQREKYQLKIRELRKILDTNAN